MNKTLLVLALLASGACPAAAELRILALGDSYTIGESVPATERWPNQLAVKLRDAGREVAPPEIIAQTGWTTGDLLAAIHDRQPRGPFALVSVMIGVNNQFQGGTLEEYQEQLGLILSEALALAGGKKQHVLVLSIPDYSVTPFGQRFEPERAAKEIAAFNRICRQATIKAGLTWIDVTPETREAADDPALVAGDGLHPSPGMYAAWADLVLPHLPPGLAH